MVYGELGKVPMSVHFYAGKVDFWKRIVSGRIYKEKISRTLYEMLYKLDSGYISF